MFHVNIMVRNKCYQSQQINIRIIVSQLYGFIVRYQVRAEDEFQIRGEKILETVYRCKQMFFCKVSKI